ncbi:hypothetical protein GobsT_40250 [Gemmata obscuriglobus]|uniref:DUF4175 domain-containing protein n=1 Tax=Gemmata obscuriglobus TaxID=114 RepID=A0A2Z3H9Y5_9BACT|nr:hypothetical protein [Gemmata obscuriglobus]AWM37910.1 hypothetical protein C1280_13540 [Gemmata obscuriglobus]QEG29235.1 hypothetical protein GobsT_40250 [Gemmata obscuriglobus]VTS08047.1 Uncharacterized protein OS=Singulisphaera acidiphila (strain ATCC BAA-1392 / DSM 18658 / VKM B-2454 / MOB10) GN=Sinac_6530 PE=4 SV=1 [Gemmata obscuriglobus UQM 2246]
MAAVLEPKDPTEAAAKLGSQVDEQLAQATTRIRAHDLALGALVLVAFVLAYATAVILLDKFIDLPQWLRQLSLLGFIGALAAITYLTIVTPLRKKINPLYAAKQVESTIDDAKNSVTGYVDAQQKGALNATVKAALARRAAKSVAEADVNKAVDHRSLLYLGGAAIALALTLVVLFFVFRPSQFGSLLTRAFVPFISTQVGTRTQIKLTKPEPAEPTITEGQTVTVAVHIGGKVPSTDSPERVRLLIRHNPADPNYIEVPMVEAETSRDFELRVPNHHVQNGFWYKVAAGDDQTDEYKVTVRSLPLFTHFQATYESPKYLRRKAETISSPLIQGYRGTTVTLTAQTNHDVRDGAMVIEPGGTVVPGTTTADDPKALQFRFKLKESGRYRLTYTTTDGEKSAEPFVSTIVVQNDAAPTLVIDKPEEEEVTVPANGQLAIDGKVGDDFGVDTITLKMRLTGATARDLLERPFLYGKSKSFKREKDGTYPTDVEYKGSVNFAELTKAPAGVPFEAKPDMVIEYWLEATDNCTEPKPNVGRSAVKRVRLAPPVVEEPKKQEQKQQNNERKNEEQKHNDDQQQKLEQERRDQPQNGGQQQQNGEQQPKEGEPQKGNDATPKRDGNDPMGANPPPKEKGQPNKPEGKQDGSGGKADGTPDKGSNEGNPMPKGAGEKSDNPSKGMNDAQPNPMQPNDPNGTGTGGMNQAETAPPPKTPDEKDVQNKAEQLKNAIEEENKSGGSVKPNEAPSAQERTDPGRAKPQPKNDSGNTSGMAEQKPEQKPDPMQPEKGAAASGKPEGNPEKSPEPSTTKPDGSKQPDPMSGSEPKNGAPPEPRNEPIENAPGTEKAQPQAGQSAPKEPKEANPKQDQNAGGSAKPATLKDADKPPMGAPNPGEKSDPAADAGSKAKPAPDPARGAEKPADPKGRTAPPEAKGETKPEGGEAKPDKAPPAGESKGMPPKEDAMNPGAGMGQPEAKPEPDGANQPQKPNGTRAAETKPQKPDAMNPPTGGTGNEKGDESNGEKPDPNNAGKPQGGSGNGAPKDKKPSEQELKEFDEAAKNLTSPDEQKKADARNKLDKTMGQEKRKELEKVANDRQSPDENTRKDAERKFDDFKKEAQNGPADKKGGTDGKKNETGGKPGDAPKLDEKQKKEMADAMKDLQSGNEQQKADARKKLDKTFGEQARKEAEQFMNDLKSDDKDKQAAAQQKFDDFKKEMEKRAAEENAKKNGESGKGKEPIDDPNAQKDKESAKGQELSKEELDALTKKAQDLQSKDQKTREQAEKELDDKIGKENRERLQEKMKEQQPGTPEQEQKLREQVEQHAKNHANQPQGTPGNRPAGSVPTKEAMEEDARNRLKTAELQLDQFEKKRYDEAFKRKQGFTDAEYEKFLRGYEKHVEKLRDDVNKGSASGEKAPPKGPAEPDRPITAGSGGKVESRPGMSSGTAGTVTTEPPGFENLRRKFEKLLNEKK